MTVVEETKEYLRSLMVIDLYCSLIRDLYTKRKRYAFWSTLSVVLLAILTLMFLGNEIIYVPTLIALLIVGIGTVSLDFYYAEAIHQYDLKKVIYGLTLTSVSSTYYSLTQGSLDPEYATRELIRFKFILSNDKHADIERKEIEYDDLYKQASNEVNEKLEVLE